MLVSGAGHSAPSRGWCSVPHDRHAHRYHADQAGADRAAPGRATSSGDHRQQYRDHLCEGCRGPLSAAQPRLRDTLGIDREQAMGRTDQELLDYPIAATFVANDRHIWQTGATLELEE